MGRIDSFLNMGYLKMRECECPYDIPTIHSMFIVFFETSPARLNYSKIPHTSHYAR